MHVTLCKQHCMHVTPAQLQALACKWLSNALACKWLTNGALASTCVSCRKQIQLHLSRRKQWRDWSTLVSQEAMAGLIHVGTCLPIDVGGLCTWNLYRSWCWQHPRMAATSAPFSPVVMAASLVSPLMIAASFAKETPSVNTFRRDPV